MAMRWLPTSMIGICGQLQTRILFKKHWQLIFCIQRAVEIIQIPWQGGCPGWNSLLWCISQSWGDNCYGSSIQGGRKITSKSNKADEAKSRYFIEYIYIIHVNVKYIFFIIDVIWTKSFLHVAFLLAPDSLTPFWMSHFCIP